MNCEKRYLFIATCEQIKFWSAGWQYWPENTFTTSVSSRSHSGGYTTNTLSSSPQRLSLPSITGIGSSSGSMRSPRSKSPLRALARRNSSPPPPSHYQLYNPCKKCTLNEICTAMVPWCVLYNDLLTHIIDNSTSTVAILVYVQHVLQRLGKKDLSSVQFVTKTLLTY